MTENLKQILSQKLEKENYTAEDVQLFLGTKYQNIIQAINSSESTIDDIQKIIQTIELDIEKYFQNTPLQSFVSEIMSYLSKLLQSEISLEEIVSTSEYKFNLEIEKLTSNLNQKDKDLLFQNISKNLESHNSNLKFDFEKNKFYFAGK